MLIIFIGLLCNTTCALRVVLTIFIAFQCLMHTLTHIHTPTHTQTHTPSHRYKDRLAAFYIVHPNWWFKVYVLTHSRNPLTTPTPPYSSQMSCWWFLTFTGSAIKDRVHYLTGVRYLYDTINPDQIDIPNFILEHDVQVSLCCHRNPQYSWQCHYVTM